MSDSHTSPSAKSARRRAFRKRIFRIQLALFLAVNTLTVGVWLMTELADGHGGASAAFWPGWPLVLWLPLLILSAFWAYSRPLSEHAARERMTK